MTSATKGFIATRNKSPFFVLELVERSINQFIGSMGQVLLDNRGRNPDEPYSRRVSVELRPSSQCADLRFVHEGVARELTVFFTTDCDRKEYAAQSINLWLGDFGHSEAYMKAALAALRPLGTAYFLRTDLVDEPFQKLELPPLSYLDACRKGLAQPSCVSLERWLVEFRTGTLEAQTEQDAFGFSLEEALRIIDMEYDESVARLKQLLIV